MSLRHLEHFLSEVVPFCGDADDTMPKRPIRVAELFAGVGGFRVGLETQSLSGFFKTVFSSQWEPPGSEGRQFASWVYTKHFGDQGHYNRDIKEVLDDIENGILALPKIDMIVGGFPCQDYSVAKPLNQSEGIRGKKGVLWWEIYRLIELLLDDGRPAKYLLFENVDRLIKSPATHRGRDFAIILASLDRVGYDVEWRVVNAADYGHPQKRRRVFMFCSRRGRHKADAYSTIYEAGILAKAFPVAPGDHSLFEKKPDLRLVRELHEISQTFSSDGGQSPFLAAGFMSEGCVWTRPVVPVKPTRIKTLGSVLLPETQIPESFFIDSELLPKWLYLKGGKKERRINKASGVEYNYAEGALPMPDPIDRPARTILTGEGGSGPSRFRHVVETPSGRLRRLVPEELEQLNEFEAGWTSEGLRQGELVKLSPTQRAFCMGNALVTGLVTRIGRVLVARAGFVPTRAKPAKSHRSG